MTCKNTKCNQEPPSLTTSQEHGTLVDALKHAARTSYDFVFFPCGRNPPTRHHPGSLINELLVYYYWVLMSWASIAIQFVPPSILGQLVPHTTSCPYVFTCCDPLKFCLPKYLVLDASIISNFTRSSQSQSCTIRLCFRPWVALLSLLHSLPPIQLSPAVPPKFLPSRALLRTKDHPLLATLVCEVSHPHRSCSS